MLEKFSFCFSPQIVTTSLKFHLSIDLSHHSEFHMELRLPYEFAIPQLIAHPNYFVEKGIPMFHVVVTTVDS